MANNLFISYDLNNPGQNYDTVIEKIKTLGNWAKVQYSLWYVNSNYSASDAAGIVWAVMDKNDSLIVIDATNNQASMYGVSDKVTKFILGHWNN